MPLTHNYGVCVQALTYCLGCDRYLCWDENTFTMVSPLVPYCTELITQYPPLRFIGPVQQVVHGLTVRNFTAVHGCCAAYANSHSCTCTEKKAHGGSVSIAVFPTMRVPPSQGSIDYASPLTRVPQCSGSGPRSSVFFTARPLWTSSFPAPPKSQPPKSQPPNPMPPPLLPPPLPHPIPPPHPPPEGTRPPLPPEGNRPPLPPEGNRSPLLPEDNRPPPWLRHRPPPPPPPPLRRRLLQRRR